MSNHQVDEDHQSGELVHLMNPEGHAEIRIETGPPDPHPVDERPIELIFSNEHPFALSRVLIFGEEFPAANFAVDAREGTLTLTCNLDRVHVMVDNE